LATALAQRGIETDVVELRADAPLGIGLNVPSNALGALDEIAVRDAVIGGGWEFEDLHVWDPDGRLVAELPPPPSMYGRPSNVAISRPLYGRILRHAAEAAGARVRTGLTIKELTEDEDGVDVVLGDPAEATGRYDLVVGFDGVHSTLRARMFGGEAEPSYTGCAVWRAALPRHPAVERIILSPRPEAKAVLTPISTTEMYVAVVTQEPGNPRQDPERLAELFRKRLAGFGGPVGELRDQVGEETPISYSPLEQVTLAGRWYSGRIALAGDAAHASTPQLAQGGAMAVEDAVVLADALARPLALPDALSLWYERRLPRAQFVQDMSRALLAQEMGQPTTPEQDELLKLGMPGAQARLAEPY
jgi:2-polyprenyl-6-methoxyphenol hydroxylase-like FAD-dependent oxidoreductase